MIETYKQYMLIVEVLELKDGVKNDDGLG